jgi:hypothetical protein
MPNRSIQLNITRFKDVYDIAVADGSDRYTLDKFRAKFEEVSSVTGRPNRMRNHLCGGPDL